MKPLISVVIPTYNRPSPLRYALSSVAVQRDVPGPVEVIVVNDAGADVSMVADAAREHGMRLRLISLEHNRGLANARNTGMQEARGEYVAFLDDDDIFLPDHLRVTLGALSTGEADLAYTRCVVRQARADPCDTPPLPDSEAFPFDADLLSVANFMPVHTAVLRHPPESARFDLGLPALEDWDMWLRLLREHHYRFTHVPQPTVIYHRIAAQPSMVGATAGDGTALARFGRLTYQMWRRWPTLTLRAQHFRLYIAVMYWHAHEHLTAGNLLGASYFQHCVEEIAAVWFGRRPETDLCQRIIESLTDDPDAAHAA